MRDGMKSPRQPVGAGPGACVLEHEESTASGGRVQAREIRRGGFRAYRSANGLFVDICGEGSGKLLLLTEDRLRDLKKVIDEILG